MTNAVVVLSGGQDSATCAAWAKTWCQEIVCVTFNYKQRHASRELKAATDIAKLVGAKRHIIYDVPALAGNPMSGLTNDRIAVGDVDAMSGLPKSFVPGRNLVFLTSAASIALSLGIADIVTGVCQTDYSGYPDCREDTIQVLERAIRLGNRGVPGADAFRIHTPLMRMTKAESVHFAEGLPLGMKAVGLSWTCYEGGEKPCQVCPACVLRVKGFHDAGVADPAL